MNYIYIGADRSRIYTSLADRILLNSCVAPESHPLTNGEPCWFWLRGTDRKGYATMTVQLRSKSRPRATRRVHREAVRAFTGRRVGKGYVIRHDCDTPWCVNPAHLRGGTASSNMRDMIARGRGRGQFKPAPGTPVDAPNATPDPDERHCN